MRKPDVPEYRGYCTRTKKYLHRLYLEEHIYWGSTFVIQKHLGAQASISLILMHSIPGIYVYDLGPIQISIVTRGCRKSLGTLDRIKEKHLFTSVSIHHKYSNLYQIKRAMRIGALELLSQVLSKLTPTKYCGIQYKCRH